MEVRTYQLVLVYPMTKPSFIFWGAGRTPVFLSSQDQRAPWLWGPGSLTVH